MRVELEEQKEAIAAEEQDGLEPRERQLGAARYKENSGTAEYTG
jgi:hypothetical protein